MPAIRSSLDADLYQVTWIANGYTLPLSALVLVGGAASDRFGVVRVVSLGIALFLLASAIATVSTSADALIAARVVKGFGAALMVPGSLALIARAYPREVRGRAIGLWAAASALTTAMGPVLGGLLLSLGSDEAWRIIFAVNIPLGAATLWILWARAGQDTPVTDKPLDWAGGALAATGLAALTLALGAFAGDGAGFVDGISPGVLLAIGAGALAAFLWWETRTDHPMMPLELFSDRVFSSANLATFCLYGGFGAVLFFLPMVAIAGWGVSEVTTSAAFVPLSVLIGLLSGRVGKLADRYGPGPLISTGAAIVALAFAGLAVTAPLQAFWAATVPLCSLMGLGMALVVGPLSTAVMASVPEASTGAGSGINNAVARVAGLIAVAAMGSLAAFIYAGPLSFGEAGGDTAHVAEMNRAFAAVAWTGAALAGLAALAAWRGMRPTGETEAVPA